MNNANNNGISASYVDFFPYTKFRDKQEEIVRRIELNSRLGKNTLLVAPNGTGKTVIALSALLPVIHDLGLKLVYLCRTHAQSYRVIRELQKVQKVIPTRFKKITGLSLRGRNEMCLNSTLQRKKSSPTEAITACKNLRNAKKCGNYERTNEYQDDIDEIFNTLCNQALDAQELIKYCKENRLCPYFLAKYLVRKVDIIICNFQWIFNPDVLRPFLRLLGIPLEKCVLVIDECHNIIDVATEANSRSLTMPFLDSCVGELIRCRFKNKFVKFVRTVQSQLDEDEKMLKLGETQIRPDSYLKSICNQLQINNLEEFKAFLTEFYITNSNLWRDKDSELDEYDENDEDEGMVGENEAELTAPYDCVKDFIKFWDKWLKNLNSDRYFFEYNLTKKKGERELSLEIVALDPRDITYPIYNQCHSSLSLTGTVNATVFARLTGLNAQNKGYEDLSAPSPFKRENILALITEGVNTKGENRNPTTYLKMISKIEEVIAHTPKNVGIFCASYVVLRNLVMLLLPPIARKYNKKLFVEESGKSASKNAQMLKSFKSASQNGNGAVLLGVCGGRNSEGEDYPGDYMNSVIIAGIPYHLQTPRVEAKIQYYDKAFNGQGWIYGYLFPAMQRANQAAGRPVRLETDRKVIVFMDDRFKERINWISDWIRRDVNIVPDVKNGIAKYLNNFWNGKNSKIYK